MTQPDRARIWTARFAALVLVNLVITFAQFMTLSLVPKLSESLGATALVVGIVSGAFGVTALAVRPAVGVATLRLRNRHLLVLTLSAMVIAFALYAFSTNLTLLIIARLVHGAAMGFLAPVTLAMAAEALPPSRIAQGIGIFSLGQAVSTAIGPGAGLWLLGNVGAPISFLIGGGLLLVAALVASRLHSEPPDRENGGPLGFGSFIAKEAVIPAVLMFCLAGAFSGVNTFIVLYGESRGVGEIGLFFAAYAVFILLARPLAGRLADRFGLAIILVPGMVMFALSFVIISQVTTLAGFLVAGAVSALGYGICQPAIQTMALTSVHPARRGVASNTNYVGVDLGYLIMPVAAGALVSNEIRSGVAEATAYSTMYLALTALIAIGLVVYLVSYRPKPGGTSGRPFPLPEPGL
jgi:MFS family permease